MDLNIDNINIWLFEDRVLSAVQMACTCSIVLEPTGDICEDFMHNMCDHHLEVFTAGESWPHFTSTALH